MIRAGENDHSRYRSQKFAYHRGNLWTGTVDRSSNARRTNIVDVVAVPAVNELTSNVHIYNIHRYTVDMKNTRTYSRTSSELVGEQTIYTGSLTWNYQLGFSHYYYSQLEVFGWKLNVSRFACSDIIFVLFSFLLMNVSKTCVRQFSFFKWNHRDVF